MIKKIGVLTSGGDCPGLNAVIRAVVKSASQLGWEVYGIPHGTDGFLDICQGKITPEQIKLNEHGYDIPGVVQGLDVLQFLSGSILGSLSRGNPNEPEVAQQIMKGYNSLGLDALVVVGGDGSLDIIYELAQQGNWKMVAVPKTIDNDVPFTEKSVGFDTAVATVTDALYNLTFTAASHDRIMVVQVMGRDAGHLGLHSGIAGGADVILIPERVPALTEDIISKICHHLARQRRDGRKFGLIVISEGVKTAEGKHDKYIGDVLAKAIQSHSRQLCAEGAADFCEIQELDTRSTVLGHIQRSGTPSSFDRLLAISFGKKAIDLLQHGQYNRLVIWQSGRVEAKPLDEVVPVIRECHEANLCAGPVLPNDFMVEVAQSLGIFVG
jgi:ATP-dependent phosphofructokinase / diphosphate-dependent phosphofructokinase